jgi:hypothetical protein
LLIFNLPARCVAFHLRLLFLLRFVYFRSFFILLVGGVYTLGSRRVDRARPLQGVSSGGFCLFLLRFGENQGQRS